MVITLQLPTNYSMTYDGVNIKSLGLSDMQVAMIKEYELKHNVYH